MQLLDKIKFICMISQELFQIYRLFLYQQEELYLTIWEEDRWPTFNFQNECYVKCLQCI